MPRNETQDKQTLFYNGLALGFWGSTFPLNDERTPSKIESLDSTFLVADASFDNYEDMCALLDLDLNSENLPSVSSLILKMHNMYGDTFIDRIKGDFSFALVDTENAKLLLARDHIGTRPLFFCSGNDQIIFSSDIRPLLVLQEGSGRICNSSIAQFLANPSFTPSQTFFRDIRRIEPGSLLSATSNETKVKRWWDPILVPSKRAIALSDASLEVRAKLDSAVARRTDYGGKIGAHISGGIDSTTVVVLAHSSLTAKGQNLTKLYSWAPTMTDNFPLGDTRDERHAIMEIGASIGTPVSFNTTDGTDYVAFLKRPLEFEGTVGVLDEHRTLRDAFCDNVGLMLSGWGGDEAFSNHSYGYLASLFRRGKFRKLAAALKRHSNGRLVSRQSAKIFLGKVLEPNLPVTVQRILRPRPNPSPLSYISPKFLSDHKASILLLENDVRLNPHPKEHLKRMLLRGHLGARMEAWAIWGAELGVTHRYPLTDRDLLESLLSLPEDTLFSDGDWRKLARMAVKDIFPNRKSKYDHADEARKRALVRECSMILKSDVRGGLFQHDCEWLDIDALKKAILAFPDDVRDADLPEFMHITRAMQIFFLHKRTVNFAPGERAIRQVFE